MFHSVQTKACRQRGGGKLNFLITLIVVGAIAATGIKVVPVYYSNNKFFDAAGEIAQGAAKMDESAIVVQILAKAREYKISEAQQPGAVRVSRVEKTRSDGVCTVRLKYTREINLFGLHTIKMTTDKEIAKPFMII